jgi:hypothetical protein
MLRSTIRSALAIALCLSAPPAVAQIAPEAASLSYADLADLALTAPVIATVDIVRATRLEDADAVGTPQGHQRFYVEARIAALLRGAGGVPSDVAYLVDAPLDSRGKPPKLKKLKMLIAAATVPGKPGELRLIARDAQRPWSAELEQRLRAVLTAAAAADVPPRITGVASAFHVPGSLPGESETQIFLQTEDKRPVSLAVLRRPGEAPRLAVALGEMVDEAAGPPARDTLLWYRLACGLPAALPAGAIATLQPAEAQAANADYRFVLDQLGACGRTREG